MELKEIPGTRGFMADELGNIYSPDGTIRPVYKNGDGYFTASVKTEDGRWVTFTTHRLTALAHIPNDVLERNQINHRDASVDNNRTNNLEWVTGSENNVHSEIMREGNQYPTVIAESGNKIVGLYRNAKEASGALNVTVMDVWDSIKESKEIKGFCFKHRPYSGRIPVEFHRPKRIDRDSRTAIKTMDVDTGEIRMFSSFASAANVYETSASHLYKSISRTGRVRLFRKKYQVAYVDEDFPEISKEDLRIAKGHGPKSVIGYNFDEKMYLITDTAKDFIYTTGLSKKAVTTALAKGILRRIESWVMIYFNDENTAKLKAYVEGPANT